MKLLLAEDDPISRRMLRATLSVQDYDVIEAEDGTAAWSILESDNAPRLVLLDWMMPGVDGVDICRRIRAKENASYTYVLLITARGLTHDVITGLEAGADDFLTKPCDPEELRCRVRAGERIMHLKSDLEANIAELEDALAHVAKLQGLLPICMHCKSIRDDSNSWHRIETYIEQHSGAIFTHALCTACLRKHYPEYADVDSRTETLDLHARSSSRRMVDGVVVSERGTKRAEDDTC